MTNKDTEKPARRESTGIAALLVAAVVSSLLWGTALWLVIRAVSTLAGVFAPIWGLLRDQDLLAAFGEIVAAAGLSWTFWAAIMFTFFLASVLSGIAWKVFRRWVRR